MIFEEYTPTRAFHTIPPITEKGKTNIPTIRSEPIDASVICKRRKGERLNLRTHTFRWGHMTPLQQVAMNNTTNWTQAPRVTQIPGTLDEERKTTAGPTTAKRKTSARTPGECAPSGSIARPGY